MWWFRRRPKKIRATFLIPKREDPNVGNGSPHPLDRWVTLQEILYDKFGGWTILSEKCPGGWQKTPQEQRADISRNYCVHFEKKRLKELINLVSVFAVMFRQECISFECRGEPQEIWQRRCDPNENIHNA